MKYIVKGGSQLNGEVNISGAKNSVLPILAATILTGKCCIENIPQLSDVKYTIDILNHIENSDTITKDLSEKMRSSILFAGSLLGARGEIKLYYPGGCQIGKRPVDLHIWALKKLGAEIKINEHFIIAKATKLKGCNIELPYVSVGATENIILAAVKSEGVTIIKNAAIEPEIWDLINFLNKCGGDIKIKDRTICIKGVSELKPIEYNIIPDRIEALTYICMGAITGGELFINNINTHHIYTPLCILKAMGIIINETDKGIYIDAPKILKCVHHFKTGVYPGIPTDIQPQLSTLMSVAQGKCFINETIFSNRTAHIDELKKMGADITKLSSRKYTVTGVDRLKPALVNAYDLRGGSALVCAALNADGTSIVENTSHIKRGYEHLIEKIKNIGGNIEESE